MTDPRSLLERESQRFVQEGGAFERLRRRRDRKRRNQRIAAAVVGLTVFVAAIWLVTTGGAFELTQTPAAPGGVEAGATETEPTETEPTVASSDDWDGHGLPPEGTALSTPVEGQPIRRAKDYNHHLIVYADGRVLWWNALRSLGADGPVGGDYVLERRLNPEGVDLVLSGVITAWDLASPEQVPASAWADAVARPYAPPRYSLCLWQKDQVPALSAVDKLPPPAEDLLSGNDPDPLHPGCLVVSTEEARAFHEIAQEASFDAAPDLGGVTPGATVGAWLLPGAEGALGEDVAIYLRPLWPDGEWHELYLA